MDIKTVRVTKVEPFKPIDLVIRIDTQQELLGLMREISSTEPSDNGNFALRQVLVELRSEYDKQKL